MFSCLQILEAFLWFVLITLLNVTLIILTLSVSRLLNLLLRLVAFLLFLNPQCLASISRWITASSSWKRFCLFVCRALSSIMVICMFFFLQAEDGIRVKLVTGVQTCALPIFWTSLVVLTFTYTHLASRYGLPEFVEVRRNASWLAMSLAILLGVATVELLRTRVTKVVAMLVALLWLWRVPITGANDQLINYSGYSATAFAVLEIQREHEPFTWTLITYGQEFPMVLGKGFHLPAVDFLDRY